MYQISKEDLLRLLDLMKHNGFGPSGYAFLFSYDKNVDYKIGFEEGFRKGVEEAMRIIEDRG